MFTRRKKILIDANPVVPYYAIGRSSGIGRTCTELIRQLDKIRDQLPFDIELYTQNIKGISAKRLNTGFRTHHVYLRHTETCNKLSRDLHLRELMSRYDLQHITHNFEYVRDPSRCIATVHDAFFMKLDVNNFDYESMRKQYPPFIRKCRHIITCSEYSKKDIIGLIGVPEERITVIHWGIDHNLFYVEQHKEAVRGRLKEELHIDNPYFLSVSCDAGRKRTHEVINAYLTLEKPANDLLLVWGNPPAEIKARIDSNPRIHLLSGISDETLRLLYNGATAAFNPSQYEGFGLPILEAMACGCPAITCSNSSLPEVGGDVAIYLDEHVSESLPLIMRAVENGELDLTDARVNGPEQASQFTWERTVEATVKVYADILGI